MGMSSFKVAICSILIIMFTESHSQEALNPGGSNVCKSVSGIFQCCHGWAQTGDECLIAICVGNFTCKENEVCVRPNECRCRHGYFGATCDMKCPPQFWGPDCRGPCLCHPGGTCDPISGSCSCRPDRWGPLCQRPCGCLRGSCDPATGSCTCPPGSWGPRCAGTCRCGANGDCSPADGRCRCRPGWYGRGCHARCPCGGSPCEQQTGRCVCRPGSWGPRCQRLCQCAQGRCRPLDGVCLCGPGYRGTFCREPCPAGLYGQDCRNRCGHCKGQQPCTVTEGSCVMCERGWNGTRCDQVCAGGSYGEDCRQLCPRCKDGHFCSRIDGRCPHCNPGWRGDRCDNRCPGGSYGDNCANECDDCFNGTCHFVTGQCVCDPGYHGRFCNVSCSAGKHGANCTHICSCHENNCNKVSGACILQPNRRMGVMAAGVLVLFLLLLLSCLLCCCCVCKHTSSENKAKHRLCGGLTRITTKLPRVPLRSHKLPNVLVSHHDPENSLDCSFIETPSTVEQRCCSSRGSYCSDDTTEDCPGYPPDGNGKVSTKRRNRVNKTETTILADEDDDDDEEYDNANNTVSVSDEEDSSTQACRGDNSSSGLLFLTTSGREGSCSQPTSSQPQQLKPDYGSSGETRRIQENGTHIAKEKVKPQPPDPSTKPKASWLHGTRDPSPRQTTLAEIIPETKQEAKTPTEKSPGRNGQGLLPQEQSVFKQTSHIHVDKKAPIPKDYVHKTISSSCKDTLHPHIDSEAVSILAAQLKAKTQSLSRSQSNGCKDSSPSQTVTKKPTPPQILISQAGTNVYFSVEKNPLLATNSSQNGDSLPAETKSPKKGDHRIEKTIIKKPPRNKCHEGHIESKVKGAP